MRENRKKRVGIISSSPLVKTGFSTSASAIVPRLYKTDKYEIFFLNQGIHDLDPELTKFPWASWGALTEEIVNQELFKKEDGYRRIAGYGNLRVEEFVTKNKLDVIFHIEDPWSSHPEFYYKKDWFKLAKNNFVNWMTADSLPILPTIKDWAKNCPNVWMWTSFAERALKEEDPEVYKNVKTLHGSLNCDNFKPISTELKKELRNKFGIDEDTFLFIHLGRNQLRKLFFANIEALAKFKKQNPEKKAKLLIYCSWTEQAGWPIQRTVEEYGLSPDDVLCVYYCQHCGHWEISSYKGEPLDCKSCGTKKSLITPGVSSNISQGDLSKIYGVCDAASSIFTSGGLEYFNVESLLCGLPLISTPYSCGEDFVCNDFVESCEGSYTRERDTNFLKFVPNTNSITKFITKIYNSSPEKRKQIGRKGREWALKSFGPDVISKTLEEFIDKCDYLDWDGFKVELEDSDNKNPEAEVDNSIVDDTDWLINLYKNILKMSVEASDEGLHSWLNGIKEGAPRENIEQQFRRIAFNHNASKHQTKFDDLIDKDRKNKRALIIAKESGGDILIISALFKDFHKRYKGYDLYVMCDNKFADILQGNPYVYKVLPYYPPAENETFAIGAGQKIGEELFNLYINPAIGSQKFFNYLSNSNPRELK